MRRRIEWRGRKEKRGKWEAEGMAWGGSVDRYLPRKLYSLCRHGGLRTPRHG